MRNLTLRNLTNVLISVILCLPGLTLAEQDKLETVVFAGGCFWCMEPPYDKLDGVVSTVSGYVGGSADNANYNAVSSGATQHYEAIEITYNPAKVDYNQLLTVFWRNIDPTDNKGQFCDKGAQYRAAIFYNNEQHKMLAQQSLDKINQTKSFDDEIVTEIIAASPFYPAEAYHQNYYQRNPGRYKFYRYSCGRDRRLEQLWGSNTG